MLGFMDETIVRCRRVIEAYARGVVLWSACEDEGLDWNLFYRTVNKTPELRALREEYNGAFSQARVPKYLEAAGDPDAKRARNRMAAEQFLMERSAPSEFGMRTTVTHEGAVNLVLSQRTDAAMAVLDAPSDYLTAEQRANAIDVAASPALATPDQQSGAQPAAANAIDIFAE